MIAVITRTTSAAAMLVSSVNAAVLSRATFMHGASPSANSRTLYRPTSIASGSILGKSAKAPASPGACAGPGVWPPAAWWWAGAAARLWARLGRVAAWGRGEGAWGRAEAALREDAGDSAEAECA